MAFNSTDTAKKLWDGFQDLYIDWVVGDTLPDVSSTWMDLFCQAYDDHCLAADMANDSVKLESHKSTLEFANSGNTVAVATNIGLAVAAYWSLQITPNLPQAGVSIISVVNDAAKIAPLITADLLTLGTSSDTTPYYKNFFDIFDTHVKTIIWSVVDSAPPITVPYTNAVS